MVVRSWVIDKPAKKMQPVQVSVVGEASPGLLAGAGRCRRTIADVDESSKKRQLFIFGVPFPTTRTETPRAGAAVRLKEQQSNLFPIMVCIRQDPRKSQNSFDQS